MASLDAKWQVPESYDITERAFALPPPRGYAPTSPMLGILSVRALEDQADGEGMFALYAWQVIAGGAGPAAQTIERLANTPNLSGIELLMLGHAYVATDAGAGAAFEIAQRARKILKQPVTAQSVEASLLLAITALPFAAERVKTLLDMLDPELAQGTDEHRAVHALVRAVIDPTPSRLDDAHTWFAAMEDSFGLAQCALVGYAHEAATTKRADVMRGYLEHAVYRYESDGRPEWAARTIAQALVPLVAEDKSAPPTEIADLLGRAALFAVQAKSEITLELVFAVAARLGYAASLRALSQFEAPTFTRREDSASAAAATAAPAPAAAATPAAAPAADAAKGKKPAAKKGGKKRAAG
ncbi:MAG TPA: hypothetical protein VLB44_06710 [Kofleriaceae bacterium]|nr:hypothetical protein [Kofleriaceae bacterium]